MIHRFSLCILCALLVLAAGARAETVVKHYGGGYSPSIDAYLYAVLTHSLEQTRPSHGEYRLQVYRRPLSASRAKLEAERGDLVNVLFSSHWTGKLVDPSRVIRVEWPIFWGHLGLRELIVRRESLPHLGEVETRTQFDLLRAGQGAGWPEVEILQSNGIDVAEGHLFEALFAMLLRDRFDYLPLSALEARPALAHLKESYPTLAVEDGLRIYYPVPFYLWVPADQPELAERLRAGLELAQHDGSLQKLFQRHFGSLLARSGTRAQRLVVLENPLVEPDLGTRLTEEFLDANRDRYILLQ